MIVYAHSQYTILFSRKQDGIVVLGLIQPFDSKLSIYLLHSSSFYSDILYYLWYLTDASGFNRSIWCFMSRSTGVPGSSNRSLYSAHNFVQ